MPTDEEVVEVAATAAEEAVFEFYDRSAVSDFDVTVHFVEGELTVDVYIDANARTHEAQDREERAVEEAISAAREAVDALFESD